MEKVNPIPKRPQLSRSTRLTSMKRWISLKFSTDRFKDSIITRTGWLNEVLAMSIVVRSDNDNVTMPEDIRNVNANTLGSFFILNQYEYRIKCVLICFLAPLVFWYLLFTKAHNKGMRLDRKNMFIKHKELWIIIGMALLCLYFTSIGQEDFSIGGIVMV